MVLKVVLFLSLSIFIVSTEIPQSRRIKREKRSIPHNNETVGCNFPRLNPFAPSVMRFVKTYPKVECPGISWVKCHYSKCRVMTELLKNIKKIKCRYRDLIYYNDFRYKVEGKTILNSKQQYTLKRSDFVKVYCTGVKWDNSSSQRVAWKGVAAGLRYKVKPLATPKRRRNDSYNILIFGFDTASRLGFIRKMPKSYKTLVDELEATVMLGNNIVGSGTFCAILTLLTGKRESEIPDISNPNHYLFFKLGKNGYRTAFYDDQIHEGIFQIQCSNKFNKRPADHYPRPFLDEAFHRIHNRSRGYCIGDTPTYKILMNLTRQFIDLRGQRFVFTFIGDISHDDFNRISTADDDFVDFLRSLLNSERRNDTLIIVMGDHGERYGPMVKFYQGRIEEMQPMLAIRLPDRLRQNRPDAQQNLQSNSELLTTGHDLHSTILDVAGLKKYWVRYKVPGASYTRALTLLKPIPRNRSCFEADIRAHYCVCLKWGAVSTNRSVVMRMAAFLVQFINRLTEHYRSVCAKRSLVKVDWAQKNIIKSWSKKKQSKIETYKIKVVLSPAQAAFQATIINNKIKNVFEVDTGQITRVNAYGNQGNCIANTMYQLAKFCYCQNATKDNTTNAESSSQRYTLHTNELPMKKGNKMAAGDTAIPDVAARTFSN